MKVFTSVTDPQIIELLNAGSVGIIRTDTLYGLLAKANNQAAVNRIYVLKGRDDSKSPIVLIHDKSQLFDGIDDEAATLLESVWPGPVSVILPSMNAPLWIRRSNASVAYRMPAKDALLELLGKVGPLIAPSANPQSKPPAMDIDEAKTYFGSGVDFYVDEGRVLNATPSQLLVVNEQGEVTRLR